MTLRTAERDLKTGKAAAACCVYEESGQGSVEEGAWRDRGRAVSRTRAGDERRPSSTAFVTFLCQHPRSLIGALVYLYNGNAWMCLTKEIENHVDLEVIEAGSGQITLSATMCQNSWSPANPAYSALCSLVLAAQLQASK